MQSIKCSHSWILEEVYSLQNAVLKLFDPRPPKADPNHGLEPQRGSDQKVVKNQKFLDFDLMQICCTQNFDMSLLSWASDQNFYNTKYSWNLILVGVSFMQKDQI